MEKFGENNLSTIFCFHSKNYHNRKIYAYARSYIEAKQLMLEYASTDNDFDLNEYQTFKIPTDILFDILNIDDTYTQYQYVLTESQFDMLSKYIINKEQNKLCHTHVLTKNSASKLMNTNSQLLTTKEYVNKMSEWADTIIKTKHEIIQMLNVVGDIYFYKDNEKVVYGKSRQQVSKDPMNYPKLLIEGLRYEDISQHDINRYNEMKRYIIENNVKKFPFTIHFKK